MGERTTRPRFSGTTVVDSGANSRSTSATATPCIAWTARRPSRRCSGCGSPSWHDHASAPAAAPVATSEAEQKQIRREPRTTLLASFLTGASTLWACDFVKGSVPLSYYILLPRVTSSTIILRCTISGGRVLRRHK